MRTLDRYIFRLTLSRVAFSFLVVVSLFLFIDGSERFYKFLVYVKASPESDWTDAGNLLLYMFARLLPPLLRYGGIATLLGCMWAVHHLAERNEFVAIKAAGVSLARALAPVYVIALGVSLFSFVLAEAVLPGLIRRGHQVELQLTHGLRKFDKGLSIQGSESVNGVPYQVVLYVGRFHPGDGTADDFHAIRVGPDGHRVHTLAARARWDRDRWTFLPSGEDGEGAPAGRKFDYERERVVEPAAEFRTRLSPALLLYKRLGPDVLHIGQLKADSRRPDLAAEFHRRLAGLLAGISVTWLGLPLLVGSPFGNPWKRRLLSLLVAGAYLVLTAVFAEIGGGDRLPPLDGWTPALAVWLPEALALGTGALLVRFKMDG